MVPKQENSLGIIAKTVPSSRAEATSCQASSKGDFAIYGYMKSNNLDQSQRGRSRNWNSRVSELESLRREGCRLVPDGHSLKLRWIEVVYWWIVELVKRQSSFSKSHPWQLFTFGTVGRQSIHVLSACLPWLALL